MCQGKQEWGNLDAKVAIDITHDYIAHLDEAYVITQYIIMTFFVKLKRPHCYY